MFMTIPQNKVLISMVVPPFVQEALTAITYDMQWDKVPWVSAQVESTVGNPEQGNVYSHIDKNHRRCDVAYPKTTDFFKEMMMAWVEPLMLEQNYPVSFDSMETPQIARYKVGEYFRWHKDARIVKKDKRTVTLVVQLDEPNAYEGGDLELRHDSFKTKVMRRQWLGTFFSADMLHQVTPVTKGERHSVAIWFIDTSMNHLVEKEMVNHA